MAGIIAKKGKHNFVDRATPDCGEYEEIYCNICGEKMDVTRNVVGPTRMTEAMARREHKHDSFICPNYDSKWHKQAKDLIELAKSTPSTSLERLLTNEATQIIIDKRHTKEEWKSWC